MRTHLNAGARFAGLFGLVLTTELFMTSVVQAMCLPSPCYRVELEVQSCESVEPSQEAALTPRLERLPETMKEGVLASYRGVRVSGKIVKKHSAACPHGISVDAEEHGWLSTGDTQTFFIGPKHVGGGCEELQIGETIEVQLAQACCDGDPNPPCYINLNTYVFGRSKKE